VVELFITLATSPYRYAHFMIDHTGTIADEMCGDGNHLGWNPDWSHAVGKTASFWFAEMAIPWASLDMKAPRDGTRLSMNFARNAAAVDELISWSPVVNGFHHPELFGSVTLGGDCPGVEVTSLPERRTGPTTIRAALRSPAAVSNGSSYHLSASDGVATSSAAFATGTDGVTASLAFTIPDGARSVTVSVTDPDREVLWRQTVTLDLPPLLPRVASVRAALAKVRSAMTAAELSTFTARLDSLSARASQPISGDDADRLAGELDGLGRRASDFVLLTRFRATGSHDTPYFVTAPPTTLKVQSDAGGPGPLAESLRLAMARAEYEPLQVVVCPVTSDLTGVRVSTSHLTGPSGAIIPQSRIVVTPVGYVHCAVITPGATLRGDVPEVLLPDRTMAVKLGHCQPFFVTIQSLATDTPGQYHGHLFVRAANAPATMLPLTVRVYPLTLPVKSHLRTAFVLWGNFANWIDQRDTSSLLDTYIAYSRFMLAHRLSPITMWGPGSRWIPKKPDGTWDFSFVDRYLEATVPLGLTTFNLGGNGEVAATSDAAFAKAISDHLKQRGWWDLAYAYGYDEASPDLTDKLRASYWAILTAVPDLKIMQTGWSPSDALRGLVKIWCPLTSSADLTACHAAQKSGDEVWWYVCCGPTAPYANLFVDYPGIDHRLLGWQTFRDNIQGFLYWGVDVWKSGPPLAQYDETNYATWNPNSFATFNGDGYLLYPGANNTPVDSVRLANLRDGFEDYDLFVEARTLAEKSGSRGRELLKLLNFGPPLIASRTDYTSDGAALLARREEILRAAEALQ
jgi:hypothetical protein